MVEATQGPRERRIQPSVVPWVGVPLHISHATAEGVGTSSFLSCVVPVAQPLGVGLLFLHAREAARCS
jgi:hypothetical protein